MQRAGLPPDEALQPAGSSVLRSTRGSVWHRYSALRAAGQAGRQLSARSVGRQRSRAIEDAIPNTWAGTLLFASLGCFFLQKALRRNAARNWGWGRTGEAAPLSRPSYAVWGATFLVIAEALVAPRVGALSLVVLMACLLALGVSGACDVRAERRRRGSR